MMENETMTNEQLAALKASAMVATPDINSWVHTYRIFNLPPKDETYLAQLDKRAILSLIARLEDAEDKLERIRDECDGKEDVDDGIPNTAMRCVMIAEGRDKP